MTPQSAALPETKPTMRGRASIAVRQFRLMLKLTPNANLQVPATLEWLW